MNYTPPLDDMLFALDRVIGWRSLFELPAFTHADPDVARAVLREGARFTSKVLSPLNETGDEQGAYLLDGKVTTPDGFPAAFRQFAKDGWPGLDLPMEYGGQSLPLTVQVAFAEMVNGACVSFGMLPIMLRAGSWLLIEHADAEMRDRVVPELAAGRCGATICITESQAGSDVARTRTRAIPRGGGSYALSGTKIFITYGDQDFTEQIVHFVLARTPDAAPGTRGLSLFVVPKRHFEDGKLNGVSVSRLEKKMGLKASPTCVLDLDEAVGYRVGSEGQGLKCMFTMVNLMRLEVATQGTAVAGAALQKAAAYALERTQGGPLEADPTVIAAHADVRRMLTVMRVRTEGMRALIFEAAAQLDLSRAARNEDERNAARQLAEFLLPVCKTGAAEMSFDVASLGIQVFGGHGYVSDAGIEQHCRDARIMAIYEGTSGIQALDLVERKLIRDEGMRCRLLASRIQADLELYQGTAAVVEIHAAVAEGLNALEEVSAWLQTTAPNARRDVQAGAYDYLHLVALVGGAWMWLRMAAAANGDAPLERAKRIHARYYARYLMPELPMRSARVRAGATVLDELNTDTLITGLFIHT